MTLLRMLAFSPTTEVAVNSTQLEKDKSIKPIEKLAELPQKEAVQLAEWRDILPKLELSGMSYALAANCLLEQISDQKVILTLSINHQPMLNPKLKDRIEEALCRHLKRVIKLEINITSAGIVTPMQQEKSEHEQKLAVAKETILQNPKVKKLLEMYDATVEVALI